MNLIDQRLGCNLEGRLAAVMRALVAGDDALALSELDSLREFITPNIMPPHALYTSGPWRVYEYDANSLGVQTADRRSICDMVGTMPIDHANANLIAVSPVLVVALRDAVDAMQYLAPECFDDDEHRAAWAERIAAKMALIHRACALPSDITSTRLTD